MKNRTKAALIGAGTVLSAAVLRDGIEKVIDRNLIGEALDREEPKTMVRLKARMKGYADDSQEESAYLAKQEQLEKTPHETVSVTSIDGTRLAGHLFRGEGDQRVVLAMHGWRSGWSRDFCLVADFLRENHCTVLYAEQRGQGESDGDYMGFGMVERFDCLEWIRWLNANGFQTLPIYLAGISMGASTVLMTAGFPDLPENVKGVLADCGFTSAKAIWKHISEENLHIPYKRHQKHVDRLCRGRIDLNSDSYSTLEAMETCRVPILFIHGSADTFVPVEMTLANYEACRSPKKLLIVEGANHGMSYLVDREHYEAAVKEFWSEQESA